MKPYRYFLAAVLFSLLVFAPLLKSQANPLRTLTDRTEADGTVYSMYGSTSYHLATCTLGATRTLEPKTMSEARAMRLDACSLCKPNLHPSVKRASEDATELDVVFIALALTNVRAEPSVTAKIVGTVAPLEWREIYKVTPGWIRVAASRNDSVRGWVKATGDNLAQHDVLSASLMTIRLEDEPWPLTTKLAVFRKQIKVGFTKAQVEMAIGAPVAKEAEETATGTTEAWAYQGRVVRFVNGKVASIKTIQ